MSFVYAPLNFWQDDVDEVFQEVLEEVGIEAFTSRRDAETTNEHLAIQSEGGGESQVELLLEIQYTQEPVYICPDKLLAAMTSGEPVVRMYPQPSGIEVTMHEELPDAQKEWFGIGEYAPVDTRPRNPSPPRYRRPYEDFEWSNDCSSDESDHPLLVIE